MLTLSYCVNLGVLCPLLFAFAARQDSMDTAFGAATDARQILLCLYATIAVFSAYGLFQIALGNRHIAVNIGVTLFSAQILYKLMTVPMVGLASPVVKTNLVVVIIHTATLVTLWRTA